MMLFTGAVCAGTKEKTAPRLRGARKRKGFWMKKIFAALLAAVMMLALAACGFLLWTLARWTKGGMTLRAYVYAQTVKRLPAEALLAAGMSAFGAVGQGIALLLENSVNWAKIGHFSALAVAAGLFIRTHVLLKRTVYDFIDAIK